MSVTDSSPEQPDLQPHPPNPPAGPAPDWLYPLVVSQVERHLGFPPLSSPAGSQLTQEIFSRILRRFDHTEEENGQPRLPTAREEAAEWIEEVLFFVPAAIRQIYSLAVPRNMEPFVQEGGTLHSRFIRRAIASVARKFSGSLHRLGMNPAEMEDELWGSTMEDLVRLLTDTSARLWYTDQREPVVFPPETERGFRRGVAVRIALSSDGRRLALYHSDHSVTLWETEPPHRLASWSLPWMAAEMDASGSATPVGMYFTGRGSHLELEWSTGRITVLNLEDPLQSVETFQAENLRDLVQSYGPPFIPDRRECPDGFSFVTRSGQEKKREYLDTVYDWTCDAAGRRMATASEPERTLPAWMREIGFEKAVYVIIKRRLIDLIRKNTHTGYVCWRCGWDNHSPTETTCSHCELDFTRCPLGCPIPPSAPLDRTNQWTCPHCGCATRIHESQGTVNFEDVQGRLAYENREWQGEHDLERIQSFIAHKYVTYRKRQIPLRRILDLKSQGLTNEEIGVQLDIPRGSVDYIWNQCRQEILLHFGEGSYGKSE